MTCSLDAAAVMHSDSTPDRSFSTSGVAVGQRPVLGSSSLHSAPARHHSFILGRSDARLRSLLNQEERDRLHCWSLIVALVSSVTGLTLLLTAAFP
ncbi:hypothetical protein [Microvirga puerhi]|uniref:Uncharacterized protein n=1 Tax=Microvirga puerhi TaxID=2876078 RepID=A0ABS7VSA9_9HYPH|nr:hypothetical protein [Microvirga puerhi]MBZ6077832.1 hypothetical protein [Microvirga puerhi]